MHELPNDPRTMLITLNGQPETLADGTTVATLLDQLQLAPIRVAVEVNEELVTRREFSVTPLHEGDRMEVVTFVGGG